jgi:membrane associated rhomboid family serine protease
MLNERDYIRGYGRERNIGCFFAPGAVATLIIANIIVFLFQGVENISANFSLVSPEVIQHGQIYRIFTYMFLHGGIGHILFNMWGLYLFGSMLENRIGSRRFYILYFISGLCGAGLWLLFNRYSPVPCVGASGAVFGIMVATALFHPNMQIMLLIPPIPMKMKTFAIVFAALEILLEISGGQGGVAHIVHLGGFVGGYIYIKALYRREVWGISSLFKKTPKHPLYEKKDNNFFFSSSAKVSQNELDRILDKISSEGINSLTEKEMETLKKAREQMGCGKNE